MSRYSSLPSINVEMLDGNLKLDKTPTGPVVLIVGTATDGPVTTQYRVTDSNTASTVFGSSSRLVKRLAEAKIGGAQNIYLYRIGGSYASITGLFGEDSEITTVDANTSVNTEYSLYIGPNPDGVTSGAVLIIFDSDNEIVYSNVTGGEVDDNLFTINGFDDSFEYVIGSPTAPVELQSALSSMVQVIDYTDTGDGTTTAFTFATTGLTNLTVTSVTLDSVATTAYTVVDNVLTFTTAPANSVAIEIISQASATVTGAEFTAGDDGTSATWKQYYEMLDVAYTDLETTVATHLVVDKAILDAPNLADGSTDTDRLEYLRIEEDDYGDKQYYWSTEKTHYQYSGTTDDSTHDTTEGTTTVVADADVNANGQPIVKYTYSEVNFAHQLGTWCNNITEDEKFVFGIIGTSLPSSTSTSVINKWVGTLPTTSSSGTITKNGSGLLGNKFLTGTTSNSPGFYLTDTGLVDGTIQYDSNGAAVDLGKFISIVPAVVVTPNSTSLGSTAAIVNAATIYAAVLSNVTPGDSTTNTVVNNVALPFNLKKTKLNELSYAKYVMMNDSASGIVVTSGVIPTSDDSDYTYVSTSIIVAAIVSRIRNRLQPYLGRGINSALMSAAETAIETILSTAVTNGEIVKYKYSVNQGDTVYELKVPLKIVPVFELRAIDIPLSLAYDI